MRLNATEDLTQSMMSSLLKDSDCQRNEHHLSSFVFACYHNQAACFKALFNHVVQMSGSNFDLKTTIGDEDQQLECLVYAVQHNNFEMLRYLITEVKLSKAVL